MTVKQHTPSGAQRSTSARTKKQPARPGRPKREGKGAASDKLTTEQKAQAEQFKRDAIAYAKTAYDAALAHYEANHNHPFALSRLAVVFSETQPGDFHMVVTLPGSERDPTVSDEDLRKWLAYVEMICRTLEHPNCSDAFRLAFGGIFTDDVLDGSRVTWTTPTVVRVMLPLTFLEMTRHADGSPEQFLNIFQTLRETLNDDATAEEARASVVGM